MPEEFLFPVFEFGLLGSTSFVALPLRPLYLPLPEPETVVVSSFLVVFCFFLVVSLFLVGFTVVGALVVGLTVVVGITVAVGLLLAKHVVAKANVNTKVARRTIIFFFAVLFIVFTSVITHYTKCEAFLILLYIYTLKNQSHTFNQSVYSKNPKLCQSISKVWDKG